LVKGVRRRLRCALGVSRWVRLLLEFSLSLDGPNGESTATCRPVPYCNAVLDGSMHRSVSWFWRCAEMVELCRFRMINSKNRQLAMVHSRTLHLSLSVFMSTWLSLRCSAYLLPTFCLVSRQFDRAFFHKISLLSCGFCWQVGSSRMEGKSCSRWEYVSSMSLATMLRIKSSMPRNATGSLFMWSNYVFSCAST